MELVLITLATFWVWETFRTLMERFLPLVFEALRPVHPILAAALPLYLLWPEWVSALAVAALVALLVATFERVFDTTSVQQVPIPRRRSTGGLPSLPR